MTTPDPSREAFDIWWNEQGQFSRAGGGDYEKTFAYNAWQAAMDHKGTEGGGPNQAYRMLVPNVDIIKPDDEYLSDDTTTWKPVGRSIFVGMPHVRAFKPGRRKIEGST